MTALNPLIADAMGKGVSAKTFGVHRRTIQQGEETYLFVNNFVMPRPSVVNDGGTQPSNIELYDSAGNLVPLTYPGRWDLIAPWGTGRIALGSIGWNMPPLSVTWNGKTIMVGYQDQSMLQVADGTYCVWLAPTVDGSSIQFYAGSAFPTTGVFQPLWENVVIAKGSLASAPTPASDWTSGSNLDFSPSDGYGISPAPAYTRLLAAFHWMDTSGKPLPPGNYYFKYRNSDGTLDARVIECTLSAPLAATAVNVTVAPDSVPTTDMTATINAAIQQCSGTGGVVTLMPGYYQCAGSLEAAPDVTLCGVGNVEVHNTSTGDGILCPAPTPYFAVRNIKFTGKHSIRLQNGERIKISGCKFGRHVNVWLTSDGGEFFDNEIAPDYELWFGGGVWVKNLVHIGTGSCNNNVERMSGDSNIMQDCWWSGGMQGPLVGQGWSGDTVHSLFLRPRWSNIDVAANRSECFMQEEGSFNNNLTVGARWDGCMVGSSMYGCASVSGNSFYKCSMRGPLSTGFVFGGNSTGRVVSGNVWQDNAFDRVQQPIVIVNSAGNNRICGAFIGNPAIWWDHEFNISPSQNWVNRGALLATDDQSGADTIEGLMLSNTGNIQPASGWMQKTTPYSEVNQYKEVMKTV